MILSYVTLAYNWVLNFWIIFLFIFYATMLERSKSYRHLSIITFSRHAWNYNVKRFDYLSSTKIKPLLLFLCVKNSMNKGFWHLKCMYLGKQTCSICTRNIQLSKNITKFCDEIDNIDLSYNSLTNFYSDAWFVIFVWYL